jgi:hypothetical protein
MYDVNKSCPRASHGLINTIDTKAKCRHLKNLPVKGFCGRCLSVRGPLPSSDPIHPPPPTHCIRVHCIITHTGKRGGGELTREKVRGATVHKAGSKIPTWLTVSPVYINSDSHLPQCPLEVNIFRWQHFALVSIKIISQWCILSSLLSHKQLYNSHLISCVKKPRNYCTSVSCGTHFVPK